MQKLKPRIKYKPRTTASRFESNQRISLFYNIINKENVISHKREGEKERW